MRLHLKELAFRFLYLFFSFICSWFVFFFFSSVWLEFIIIRFNDQASGVFFCLSSLFSSRVNVSAFLALLLLAPFLVLEFGCYLLPSFFFEERISFVIVCFVFFFNFFFRIFVWWYYLMPLFYFVFINWFRSSGLAITFIPEITALISFMLFILLSFVLFSQLPRILVGGVVLGMWDILDLGKRRVWFYFLFICIRTLLSPPEFWVQLTLLFIFFLSLELTLFISSFIFISKVFYL
jgi:sec-independent protein translocase protein TatC